MYIYVCANNVQMSNNALLLTVWLCRREPMIQITKGRKTVHKRAIPLRYTCTSEDIYTVHGHCTSRGGHWRILEPSVSIIPADLRQLLLCSGRLHSTGPWALQAPSHQCMHVWCFDTLAAECAHASPCQCALPCSSVQRNPWWHQLLDADPLPFDINTTIYQQLALCSYSTGYNTTSRRFLGFCSAVPFRIIATNSL